MNKRFLLILVLMITFLVGALPVHAAAIGDVYVDTTYTGTEDGTKEHPYNTILEGKAFAQAQSGGAWLWLKQADGTWLKYQYVPPAKPGQTGVPLTSGMLYALLAVLALILVLAGWQFQRRSRQLNG